MFHDRQSESNFKFWLMDIIKFEKIYAELIAQGIDPSEFSAWLVSFDRRQPYAVPVCRLGGRLFMSMMSLKVPLFTAILNSRA